MNATHKFENYDKIEDRRNANIGRVDDVNNEGFLVRWVNWGAEKAWDRRYFWNDEEITNFKKHIASGETYRS